MIGRFLRPRPGTPTVITEAPDDLVNGPERVCECGDACCGGPLIDPDRGPGNRV